MKENEVGLYPDGSMETFTSKHVNPFFADPDSICIEDIAHHLSLICRFNGACKRHYSVGQHSLLVADYIDRAGGDAVTRLAGLLHDSSEAYLGDKIRPVKYRVRELVKADHLLENKILQKFGAVGADWVIIKEADDVLVATEAYQLMESKGKYWQGLPEPLSLHIPLMHPGEVEQQFLAKFHNLRRILSLE